MVLVTGSRTLVPGAMSRTSSMFSVVSLTPGGYTMPERPGTGLPNGGGGGDSGFSGRETAADCEGAAVAPVTGFGALADGAGPTGWAGVVTVRITSDCGGDVMVFSIRNSVDSVALDGTSRGKICLAGAANCGFGEATDGAGICIGGMRCASCESVDTRGVDVVVIPKVRGCGAGSSRRKGTVPGEWLSSSSSRAR